MTQFEMIDITPSPRVLRMLGELSFQPWHCFAELIDNSIDAFQKSNSRPNEQCNNKLISVKWTKSNVAQEDRQVEVVDNAGGMSLDQLQNAVRAGCTSNDPINHLGLFGMGFNISTARLGESTTIITTRKNDPEWVGLELDFNNLINSGSFNVPILRFKKSNISESGTKITITKLKPNISDTLISKEGEIRKMLESIYSPLLSSTDIKITVSGTKLSYRPKCVWSENRYVIRNGKKIPAIINIDKSLGKALFDIDRNAYLTPTETDDYNEKLRLGVSPASNLVEREKKITGWIGIQRFADTNSYGIDFIRNGRKILINDKSLFSCEVPYTDTKILQYPNNLGTSVGGRIVGEITVDYLLPTYHKNAFNITDNSWNETVEVLSGTGPLLPNTRKIFGYGGVPNESPLGLLVSGYSRPDAGTKYLFAPNPKSKELYQHFFNKVPEYIDDSKWWKLALEADQANASNSSGSMGPVDSGNQPSDDISVYINEESVSIVSIPANVVTQPTEPPEIIATSKIVNLINNSEKSESLSGYYSYANQIGQNVEAYSLKSGEILIKNKKVPCIFESDANVCKFLYNMNHPILTQYTITPKQLLLLYLSEKLKVRDQLPDIIEVYSELVKSSMIDEKIDKTSLKEIAESLVCDLRTHIKTALSSIPIEVLDCIHLAGETEKIYSNLLNLTDQNLIVSFQNKTIDGYDAIDYVPIKTLISIVKKFPLYLFDGKVFTNPYATLNFDDQDMTNRVRSESLDRIIYYLSDLYCLMSSEGMGGGLSKHELLRVSLSITILKNSINS
ncbi:MAG: ATP-binding protein [Christensenellaceae bacterium]|jgi:hypothetical protein|nr:ATP-binding protein [Christensenellaceae bacterium]